MTVASAELAFRARGRARRMATLGYGSVLLVLLAVSAVVSEVYPRSLIDGLTQAANRAGVTFSADSEGGMFGFFLLNPLPQNYATVMATDGPTFNRFFHAMLDKGVYYAPALYEAGFVSSAHTAADIDATVAAAAEFFAGR